MNPKREKVQKFILEYVGKIVSGDHNVKLYKELFDTMTDKDFDKFMNMLKDGKIHLSVICPNTDKPLVSVENNIKVGKELGHEFFQRYVLTNKDKDADNLFPDHVSTQEFLVLRLPCRLAQQLLSKKVSIPEHNLQISPLTGQVTGASRAAKMSLPEQQVLSSIGMKDTILELVKYRGGDTGANDALTSSLYKYGDASQVEIAKYSTGVRSTATLNNYLLGMHIKSTLKK